MKTHYDTLGLPKSASAADIKKAFILRTKMMHPDRFSQVKQRAEWDLANEMLKELNVAYDALKDPISRRDYDATLNRGTERQNSDARPDDAPPSSTSARQKPPPTQNDKKNASTESKHSVSQGRRKWPFAREVTSLYVLVFAFLIFRPLIGGNRAERILSQPVFSAARERLAVTEYTPQIRTDNPEIGFSKIPGGSFLMGSSEGDSYEKPVHRVSVTVFFMGETEVTYGEWRAVMAWAKASGYTFSNEGKETAERKPVTNVNWYDVVKWCNAKSEKNGVTPCYRVAGGIYRNGEEDRVACDWNANGYRLPTEAEWEKAARGGLEGRKFPNGDRLEKTDANIDGSGTVEVGKYLANAYGLKDMAGNVFEWCWNWSAPYDSDAKPQEAVTGLYRVLRGGSWFNDASDARSAYRSNTTPTRSQDDIGFRLVRGRL